MDDIPNRHFDGVISRVRIPGTGEEFEAAIVSATSNGISVTIEVNGDHIELDPDQYDVSGRWRLNATTGELEDRDA